MKRTIIYLLFIVALSATGCAQQHMSEADWVYFEDWDMDHDYKLDSAEFINGFVKDNKTKESKDKVEETARSLFTSIDENKDGLVGSLEFYLWEIKL